MPALGKDLFWDLGKLTIHVAGEGLSQKQAKSVS